MREKTDLSIVVPLFNEEESLPELYPRLSAVLSSAGLACEIILVDDGSTDRSLEIIEALAAKDPRVKLISFSRNFGHMAALSAGLDYAGGDAVVTLDADLQHPPELIPAMLKKWKEGAEIVNAIRSETQGAGAVKNETARFFYWLIGKIGKINLPEGSADYRLLDRKVVEALKGIQERSRFLRGIISWVGFKQESVVFEAPPRFAGRTKYSFGKMFAFALDGITSFSAFPLKLSAYLGLCTAGLSFVYTIYAVYIRLFTNRAIEGWTSVLVAVLFIGGVQLIFLGVLGEYLGRVFEETKGRPLYIVSKKIGF
jgi:dolichol-phosphate mannosyltransferase